MSNALESNRSMADGVAFIEGQYVPIAQARIPITDWGFLHSDATYDVAHVWKGKFFRLDDHLQRFHDNMEALHLDVGLSRDAIQDILTQCVIRSGLREAYVEMVATRGQPTPGSRDPRSCRNQFYAFAIPFIWVANSEQQALGLHAYISDIQRIPPSSVNPIVKNYHWLDFVMGLYQAYDKQAETVILTDAEGYITEGPGFNVFAVHQGQVLTPQSGVLRGITRQTVIELAREQGLTVQETQVSVSDCLKAQELFLSSTAGGVVSITRVNGQEIGDGTPGHITQQLKTAYWESHNRTAYTTAIPYPTD